MILKKLLIYYRKKRKAIYSILTHWGRMTHICVSKLTVIGSNNGLSPSRRHAIIWTNAGILLIGPLGTNFNEVFIEIHTFSFKKNPFENVVWKMASISSRPQCVKSLIVCLIWHTLYFTPSFPWRIRTQIRVNAISEARSGSSLSSHHALVS